MVAIRSSTACALTESPIAWCTIGSPDSCTSSCTNWRATWHPFGLSPTRAIRSGWRRNKARDRTPDPPPRSIGGSRYSGSDDPPLVAQWQVQLAEHPRELPGSLRPLYQQTKIIGRCLLSQPKEPQLQGSVHYPQVRYPSIRSKVSSGVFASITQASFRPRSAEGEGQPESHRRSEVYVRKGQCATRALQSPIPQYICRDSRYAIRPLDVRCLPRCAAPQI